MGTLVEVAVAAKVCRAMAHLTRGRSKATQHSSTSNIKSWREMVSANQFN